ncbi:hypothetical protein BJX66DRAFT_333144 [Aspergillus keveii]|uniref:AAA+ ATPase lid domain-containing protein n=1 Tax=Aspergillus keveii TaxID=714993 RepID=A0ABR4GJK2_9EURO
MNLERLDQIEKEKSRATKEPRLTFDREGILAFARTEFQRAKQGIDGRTRWNGRQIRNAVLIASALARYDKSDPKIQETHHSDLRAHHFKIVVQSGLAFESYLYKVKRMTDGEKAYLDGVRADKAGINVKPTKANPEHSQELSRSANARPSTPSIGAPPQVPQEWPQASPRGQEPPYTMPYGQGPAQNLMYLSAMGQAGSMQYAQQPHYPAPTGYPGQMGQTHPPQTATHQNNPIGGYEQGHNDRQGGYDSRGNYDSSD